jgi:hypothetical protein
MRNLSTAFKGPNTAFHGLEKFHQTDMINGIMKCKQLEKKITDFLDASEPDNKDVREITAHIHNCRTCREKYQSVLEGEIPENVVPKPSKIRSIPSHPEAESSLLDPIEFKDEPVKFTLHLDGREEPIKVVEPEFDTPIPDDSRLVVNLGRLTLADVRFAFKPDRQRPYTLNFRVRNRRKYQPPKMISFGPAGKDKRKMFKETIVDEGGIRADIEMTHGKARLHIRYQPS